MATYLWSILPIFLTIAAVYSTCPNGWVVYEGSCYLFAHQTLTFIEAERTCAHDGAHLVHIENSAENGFLKGFCDDQKDADHWIGLTDQTIENEWLWYDTNSRATFTDWAPGEPNQGKNANCAILWISPGRSHYQWADNGCTEQYRYICEKSTCPYHEKYHKTGKLSPRVACADCTG